MYTVFTCFNPFFIRASVYWNFGVAPIRAPPFSVSIPSSSGHQFTASDAPAEGTIRKRFNPFFIRASVYCAREAQRAREPPRSVSIPSSSGHQFTACGPGHCAPGQRFRFNPFFIRASVYWQRVEVFPPTGASRFNPFFIRASVYCAWRASGNAPYSIPVSIPSSSGHQFTAMGREVNGRRVARVSIPSSSGHQFTVRSTTILKFAVMAEFQSLLHQGISLLLI